MGFGAFEGLWRTITGKVVWSNAVDFRNGEHISFRLKSNDDLFYVVMTLQRIAGNVYYPMDRGDLQNLEAALLATRSQLDASRLAALGQQKEAEMMRLGTLERTWRWVADTPLWKEDVHFKSGTKISFHIRRKIDETAEILFRSGEEIIGLRLGVRELHALEDALRAAMNALDGTVSSA